MRDTSARRLQKAIPFGINNALTIQQLMEKCNDTDEMVLRCAATILREHGVLIFTTEDGLFYQPESPEELEEYRQRRPAELRAMLAFRNMRHYGFNQRTEL